MSKIIVRYWKGTTQLEGTAKTYAGAMRVASRNENAYGPTFFTTDGEKLVDYYGCLVTEAEIERQAKEPATALRVYA